MATFLEQLKDGIANALGIEDKPQKGVVIPQLKPLPTINRGKSLAQKQTEVNNRQDKAIANVNNATKSSIQSLSRQIAILKKQDLQQKRMLYNLQKQLRKRQVSMPRYNAMARTIANNKRSIKNYKNELYRQKRWVNREMKKWQKSNANKHNNNNAYMNMMKQQMRLLERIANQKAQRNILQKKNNSNSRGNSSSRELIRLRRELAESQRLLKSRRRHLVRRKINSRMRIANRRVLKLRNYTTRRPIHRKRFIRITKRIFKRRNRTVRRPIRRKRFRRIIKRAGWGIPAIATGRLISRGIKKMKMRKPFRKQRLSIRRRLRRRWRRRGR